MENQTDEIELVDILRVLWRRRVIIFATTTLCLSLGIAFALLKTDAYSFKSSIEIGSVLDAEGKKASLEPFQDVKNKLTEVYIPLVQSTTSPDSHREIVVKTPEDGGLILLESQAPSGDGEVIAKLHQGVLKKLLEDHSLLFEVAKKRVELALSKARSGLDYLKNPKVFAVRQNEAKANIMTAETVLAQLKDQGDYLTKQVANLEKQKQFWLPKFDEAKAHLDEAIKHRGGALAQGVNDAVALMMVDEKIQTHQAKADALEERIYLGLEEKREVLQNKIEANSREQISQRAKIDDLKSELDKMLIEHDQEILKQQQQIEAVESQLLHFKPTRALTTALMSSSPVGKSRALIVALSGILGGMLGVFCAFVFEVFSKIKTQPQAD